MPWQYRYEAKGIQSWIMATTQLKELRGGSEVVDSLGDMARNHATACGGEVRYVAAGGGTISFPDCASLERFAAVWPMVLHRTAPGLHVIQAWAEGTDMKRVYERLGEARSRASVDLPEAGPWTARAPRSGLPAIQRRDGVFQDAGAQVRYTRGLKKGRLGPEKALAREDLGGSGSWVFVDDLHDAAWEDEPIAVVHADGNGVGKIVMGLSTDDRLSEFARLMDDATKKSACAAVTWLAQQIDDPSVFPARPVVIGGDDFTFIVQARHALQFLATYLAAFETNTAEIGNLTACGGVAIVRRGFPFATAHGIAEHACKHAKSELRGKLPDGRTPSGLCFERVTTAERDHHARSAVYTLDEIDAGEFADWKRLIDLSEHIHQHLPTGKLRHWVSLKPGSDEEQRLMKRIKEVATRKLPGQEAKRTWDGFETRLNGIDDQRRLVADALNVRHVKARRALPR